MHREGNYADTVEGAGVEIGLLRPGTLHLAEWNFDFLEFFPRLAFNKSCVIVEIRNFDAIGGEREISSFDTDFDPQTLIGARIDRLARWIEEKYRARPSRLATRGNDIALDLYDPFIDYLRRVCAATHCCVGQELPWATQAIVLRVTEVVDQARCFVGEQRVLPCGKKKACEQETEGTWGVFEYDHF